MESKSINLNDLKGALNQLDKLEDSDNKNKNAAFIRGYTDQSKIILKKLIKDIEEKATVEILFTESK